MKTVCAFLEQGVTSGGASTPPSSSGLGSAVPTVTAEFDDSKHPRGEGGKFSHGRSVGGGKFRVETPAAKDAARRGRIRDIQKRRQAMKDTFQRSAESSELDKEKRGAVLEPHDEKVPVRSFLDDVQRKTSLRKVMGRKDNKFADEQDMATDELQTQDEQFSKEEVNYRYSGKMDQACGACRYFEEPGACRIVSGLIRPVDVCDEFDPRREPGVGGSTVRAELVTTSEVAPPGYEHVVKALKKQPGVENPYAVAWAMKGRRGDAEEVSPPGWEGTVKRMKDRPDIDNPWALAWSMKSKGYRPHYGPRGGKKKTTVTSEVAY